MSLDISFSGVSTRQILQVIAGSSVRVVVVDVRRPPRPFKVIWSKDIWEGALEVIRELLRLRTEAEAQWEQTMDEVDLSRLTGRMPCKK